MISISALRCWFSWNNLRGLKVSNGAKTLSYEAYAYRFRQGTCKNYPVPFFHPWYHRKLLPHSSLWKSLSHIGDVNYLQVNKTQTWQLSIQFQALLHIKVHISVELILYFKRRSTTKYSRFRSCTSRLQEKARFPKLCLLSYHQRKIIMLFYEGGGNVGSRLSARLGTEEQVETFDCSPVLFREKAWCQLFLFFFFFDRYHFEVACASLVIHI